MKSFPAIFKRTTTGKIQIWFQEINDSGNAYRTVSGQQDGKKVTSLWYLCEPKNVGRSNETSVQEQTELEVASNYRSKLESGYVEAIGDVDNVKLLPFKPMLAKNYNDYDVKFGEIFSQPKLDGIRAIVRHDHIRSRTDKPLVSCPHIVTALEEAFALLGLDTIFDGELYAHKLRNDFEKIVSLAKKTKPTTKDLIESAEKVQYWIYDIPSHPGSFEERQKVLHGLVDVFPQSIVLVPTVRVSDQDHLDQLYSEYLEDGMEGQMVRCAKATYKNKRTTALLKRKEFMDAEFVILDILEGSGNRSGMAGSILYRHPDGRTFNSGIAGGADFYRLLLSEKHRFIGKLGTVVFFEYTNDGVPRFPVTKIIHETPRF